MADYTRTFAIKTDTTGQASTLRGQLYDGASASGSAMTTGFAELATSGCYVLTRTLDDALYGTLRIYDTVDTALSLITEINPRELAFADKRTSTIGETDTPIAYDRILSIATGTTGQASTLRAQLYESDGDASGSLITSGFVEVGTAGEYELTLPLQSDFRGAVLITDTVDATLFLVEAINPEDWINTDVRTSTVTGGSDLTVEEIATGVRSELAVELARIDVAVSTRSSHTAADVWAATTRTLTSFGSLATDVSTVLTGINTLLGRFTSTRAGYLDELGAANLPADIDTLLARLSDAKSTLLLNLANLTAAAPTVAQIADGVWDEPLTGHATSGTAGDKLTEAAAGGGGGTSTGTGAVSVNHTYGATEDDPTPLLITDTFGNPIGGAKIVAYLASAYASAPYTAQSQGWTESDDDGTWQDPLGLDAGVAYTIVVYPPGGGKRIGTHNLTPSES